MKNYQAVIPAMVTLNLMADSEEDALSKTNRMMRGETGITSINTRPVSVTVEKIDNTDDIERI